MHFVCFLGLLVVNIFIKDAEPGNGNRTKATRVFWLCKLNNNNSNVPIKSNPNNCRTNRSSKSSHICMRYLKYK